MAKVTKDMTLGDVVAKHPHAAEIMMRFGLHCIGCHVSAYETVEQGALGHGMSAEDLDSMLKEINKAIEKSK
ncbi:MAG: DUF1858 domain-containing protein [archaeon]